MADERFTADEKLLNIIEHGMGVNGAEIKPAGIEQKINIFKIDKERLKNWLTLRKINVLLVFFCVFLTVFWVFDFGRNKKVFDRRMQNVVKMATSESNKLDKKKISVLDGEINLPELLFEANRKNIFSLQQESAQLAADAAVNYSALMKNFRLVGIFWSDSPQAMIENINEGKTYLLSGQDLLGDFVVRKVLQDRVIIGKDDKEWELR